VDENKEPGIYEIELTAGSFGNASHLSSGVYIYRMVVNDFAETRKLMLVK
jgi:hypothetical protein